MKTEIQKILTPYQINDKIRLGSKHGDGGYIISKRYLSNHLVSAGCNNHTSFEEDYLSTLPDSKVDIYDGNSGCSLADSNPNVTFHSKHVHKLSDLNLTQDCNAQIDIEGAELEIFLNPDDDLSKLIQFSVEIHLNMIGTEETWIQCLKNISSTHNLIHIHANNHEMSNSYGVPSVLELSYVRAGLIDDLVKETQQFPISGLDFANNGNGQDITLNWWLL